MRHFIWLLFIVAESSNHDEEEHTDTENEDGEDDASRSGNEVATQSSQSWWKKKKKKKTKFDISLPARHLVRERERGGGGAYERSGTIYNRNSKCWALQILHEEMYISCLFLLFEVPWGDGGG